MIFDLETRALFIGKTKCGKTYLCRKIQEKFYPRRVIVDSLGEYKNTPGAVSVDNLADFVLQLKKLYESKAPRFVLIYTFRLGFDDEQREREFNEICKLVFHFKAICLVVEEAQKFCNPHKIVSWFADLMTLGRHNKIAVLMTTQKPSFIHKVIPDQCDHVFIGTIQGVNDKKYCADFLGISAGDFVVNPARVFTHYTSGQIQSITADII
jgi:hypothetical protein